MTTRNPLLREFMLTRFVSVEPTMDIDHATRLILSNALMGAPVVERGALVGVLSEKDVFRVLANRVFELDNDNGGTVADFMTRDVVTLDADLDLATVASMFLSHVYRGLPVVEGQRLVGLVSRRDILRALVELRQTPRFQKYPDYRRPQD